MKLLEAINRTAVGISVWSTSVDGGLDFFKCRFEGDRLYDEAVRHFEAAGSPIVTDGEQRKYRNLPLGLSTRPPTASPRRNPSPVVDSGASDQCSFSVGVRGDISRRAGYMFGKPHLQGELARRGRIVTSPFAVPTTAPCAAPLSVSNCFAAKDILELDTKIAGDFSNRTTKAPPDLHAHIAANNPEVTEVRTHRIGRRQHLADAAHWWPTFASLVKTPIQGSCAEVQKLGMLDIGES